MLTVPVSTEIAAAAIQPLQVGPYTVDPTNCTVQVEGGPRIPLTRFEMGILAHLVKEPGRAVSKDELAEVLYPGVVKPQSNGLEVFVKRIRQKIDPGGIHKPVLTVRTEGYKFRSDWQRAA